VGVQEVRRDNRGTIRAGNYYYFYGKEMIIINWEQFLLHHRIVSAVKRVEFVSDRVST